MVEETIQANRDNLLIFLDFVAEKGLMKRQTAVSYKKACNVILKILDEREANDLTKVDLEAVFRRHRNLAAGRISPSTLKSYEARTRAAIENFLVYFGDPSSWKSSVQTRASRTTKVTPSVAKSKSGKSEEAARREGTPWQPSVHIDLQIHISPEAKPEQIDQIFESISRHIPLK